MEPQAKSIGKNIIEQTDPEIFEHTYHFNVCLVARHATSSNDRTVRHETKTNIVNKTSTV